MKKIISNYKSERSNACNQYFQDAHDRTEQGGGFIVVTYDTFGSYCLQIFTETIRSDISWQRPSGELSCSDNWCHYWCWQGIEIELIPIEDIPVLQLNFH